MSHSRFDDSATRCRRARKRLPHLQAEYEKSLSAKEVSAELRADVAAVIEDLRSALDYCARELYERHGATPSGGHAPKVYFPIIRPGSDWPSVMGKCIPGLMANRPDIASLIAGYQVTRAAANQWLPDLSTLAAENKHEQLTPQERRTAKELKLSGGGAAISIGEGAGISLGQGASISIGGKVLSGGQSIDVDHPPVGFEGDVTRTTWVSFLWEIDGRKVDVLKFLEKATQGVEAIVEELAAASCHSPA